ncbi:MAG: HepT-like ribonuclease domain-containing protein [Verrucomicrobiota bacterium]
MTPPIQKLLVDALMAADSVSEFLKEKTEEDFKNDLLLRSAVERQLIAVGEALNLASNEKEDLELDIPELWKVIGLRHRLVHGYDLIDDEVIWALAQSNLPVLTQRLRKLLD